MSITYNIIYKKNQSLITFNKVKSLFQFIINEDDDFWIKSEKCTCNVGFEIQLNERTKLILQDVLEDDDYLKLPSVSLYSIIRKIGYKPEFFDDFEENDIYLDHINFYAGNYHYQDEIFGRINKTYNVNYHYVDSDNYFIHLRICCLTNPDYIAIFQELVGVNVYIKENGDLYYTWDGDVIIDDEDLAIIKSILLNNNDNQQIKKIFDLDKFLDGYDAYNREYLKKIKSEKCNYFIAIKEIVNNIFDELREEIDIKLKERGK